MKNQVELSAIIQNLMMNDVKSEIFINALVSILMEKKNPDGTPFLSQEDLSKKLDEVNAEMKKEMTKRKLLTP